MTKPIAKFTPPSCAGLYPREALFARFDRQPRDQVVWLCGPPGSGKSGVLASYLKARRLRALWYRVDEGDADLASFFHHLELSAQALRASEKALPRFGEEHRADPVAFSRHFFRRLFATTGADLVLVLDDVQKVSSESFHAVVRGYIEEMPVGYRLFVGSRTEPGEGYARLTVNRRLASIGWGDLRLSLEETSALAAMEGRDLTAADLAALHQRSTGWVAGVMVMLQRGGGIADPADAAGADHETMFRYFAEEIFERMDPAMRDFTLRTAWLPWIPQAAAAAFTPKAHALLAQLHRRHHFTDREEGGYRYHDLFREFLRAWAIRHQTPAAVSAMRADAAAVCARAGMPEAAIVLYAAAARWQPLAELLQVHAEELLANGWHTTLEMSLDSLPAPQLEQWPGLMFWLGACKAARDPERARDLLERAFAACRARADDEGALRAWCAATDLSLSSLSHLRHLAGYVQWLSAQFPRLPENLPPALRVRTAANMRRALWLTGAGTGGDDYWSRLADTHLTSVAQVDIRVQIAEAHLSDCVFRAGSYARAEGIYHAIADLAADDSLAPLTRIRLAAARHAFHWSRADGDNGLAAVREAMDIAAAAGIGNYRNLHHGLAFRYCMLLGRGDDAHAHLEAMTAGQADAPQENRMRYHLCASWYALENGDDAKAYGHAQEVYRLADEAGVPCVRALAHIALAQTRLALGRPDEALAAAEAAIAIARAVDSACWLFNGLVTRACLALRAAPRPTASPQALEDLKAAFALGRERGFVYVDYCRPRMLQQLCAIALRHDIEPQYAKRLVRAFALNGSVTDAAPEAWPWPVKIFTLRPFAIHRDDAPVRFATKAQAKPLLLLKALIACGAERVSEAHLTQLLWPDAEGDRAHWVFRVTLRRLRQLLGHDSAVEMSNGQLSLNPAVVWCDVTAFTAACLGLDQCLRDIARRPAADAGHADAAIVQSLNDLLALYRGHFLIQESSHEHIFLQAREKLRSQLSRAIRDTGQYWESRADWVRAADCYRRGLESDPLAEDLYCGLMQAYHQQGLAAEATRTYQRCLEIMRAMVDVEPGQRVRELFGKIRRQSGQNDLGALPALAGA